MPAASPPAASPTRLVLPGSGQSPATWINPTGLFWFVLLVGSAIPVYWLGFQSLGRAWMTP